MQTIVTDRHTRRDTDKQNLADLRKMLNDFKYAVV